MNNIVEERKRLVLAATREKLTAETLDDFKELSQQMHSSYGVFHFTTVENFDRLTVELMKAMELKKIASILAENGSN